MALVHPRSISINRFHCSRTQYWPAGPCSFVFVLFFIPFWAVDPKGLMPYRLSAEGTSAAQKSPAPPPLQTSEPQAPAPHGRIEIPRCSIGHGLWVRCPAFYSGSLDVYSRAEGIADQHWPRPVFFFT